MIVTVYGSVLGLDPGWVLMASLAEALIETAVLTVLANRYFPAS